MQLASRTELEQVVSCADERPLGLLNYDEGLQSNLIAAFAAAAGLSNPLGRPAAELERGLQ